MENIGRVATWLELAIAPEWRREAMRICVHPVGPEDDQCFAVSMDGRRLCASDGKLTTFRGRRAVERFLSMVHIDDFDICAPDPTIRTFPRGHFCLCLNRQNCLSPCEEHCEEDGQAPASCKRGQFEWHQVAPRGADMFTARRI
ncbi:hypothetical protein J5J83_08035 [Azoarcus sp. L1K30]|uniref:hypothetical protein n=1 Tax=Azoarcus sp. L1K30 TaxID=2820277 RepID=UPI001B824458|nr:hypothetical protein [Azoarcus sp. L1K30]MBR0566062.1 hypothetical protein [Azoarcus sp. L1K30]